MYSKVGGGGVMPAILNKLTKREKVLLYILLLVVIIASIGTFITKPLLDKNSELRDELFELEADEFLIRYGISKLEMEKKNVIDLEDEVQELLGGIYPKMGNNEIDTLVTDIVLLYNLEPQSINISSAAMRDFNPYMEKTEETDKLNILTSTVNIRLVGMVEDLKALLDLLYGTRAMKVSSCNITPGEMGSLGGEVAPVNIFLSFEIYMHEDGTLDMKDFVD